jgi:hypothetical protein
MKQSCAVPSEEFTGHCLALTLLGSYLTDAYDGDVRCREEVSKHLAHDVRQGTHARRVMGSYQTWFGEGPELSVLRILDEKTPRVLQDHHRCSHLGRRDNGMRVGLQALRRLGPKSDHAMARTLRWAWHYDLLARRTKIIVHTLPA